jgi:hypothetical protein
MTRPPTEAASTSFTAEAAGPKHTQSHAIRPRQSWKGSQRTRNGAPPLRARCSFQCLVGNRVGEDFFVSLVEVAGGVVHGHWSFRVKLVGSLHRLTGTSLSKIAHLRKRGHPRIKRGQWGMERGQYPKGPPSFSKGTSGMERGPVPTTTPHQMTRPPTEAASAPLTFPLRPVQSADATSTRKPARTSPPGRKGRRARGSLQGLVGNRVGEDFFVSLVEVGIGLLVHSHSSGVGAGTVVGFFKRQITKFSGNIST